MQTIIATERCVLLNGDAGDIGGLLAPDSVDAMVTDPPAGIGFMGKEWDGDKGGRDAWIAWLAATLAPAFAALKPGAHALVWALPRTSHWTATALENLGFEIRDVHMHIFGTGFPKSLDVSKAIDAKLGAEREVTGAAPRAGMATAASGYTDNEAWSGERRDHPATSDAERWKGWGTALKPAAEHWILCRKPPAGTVASNVLAHGTGGLNIDATRIGSEERYNPPAGNKAGGAAYMMGVHGMPADAEGRSAVGRWPAHVSFDEDAAAMLDEQSGSSKPKKGHLQRHAATDNLSMSGGNQERLVQVPDDPGGGASRFFYVAKPSRGEKEVGLKHLAPRTAGEATYRKDGSAGLDNPRAGAGRTGGARNFHPTVKSIALMRWLVRLITPPGGIVLDPFAGSGTTGVAALVEGARFIGVERDTDYIPITKGRLEHALKGTK